MDASGSICRCGCTDQRGESVHVVAAALAVDDLDRAIEAGLLTCEPCPGCEPACNASALTARDARRAALAARDRFRARETRLQRRAGERAARRGSPAVPEAITGEKQRPALPSAAAAALARAKAKAAEKH